MIIEIPMLSTELLGILILENFESNWIINSYFKITNTEELDSRSLLDKVIPIYIPESESILSSHVVSSLPILRPIALPQLSSYTLFLDLLILNLPLSESSYSL